MLIPDHTKETRALTLDEWVLIGQDWKPTANNLADDPAIKCAEQVPLPALRARLAEVASVMARSHTHRMRHAFLLRTIARAEAA